MTSITEKSDSGSIRPLQVVLDAWRIYRSNAITLIAIAVAGLLCFAVSEIAALAKTNRLWWAGRSLFVPGVMLYLWASAAMVVATSAARAGEHVSLRMSFERVSPRFWRYAMAFVLYWLLSCFGLFALVVLGLYWSTVHSLAGCAALLQNPSASVRPLRRSSDLIKGNFWPSLALMFVLATLAGAGLAGTYAVSHIRPVTACLFACIWVILLWPFWTAVHTVAYDRVTRGEQEKSPTDTDVQATSSCLTGCGLAVLLTVLLTGAASGTIIVLGDWIEGEREGGTPYEGAESLTGTQSLVPKGPLQINGLKIVLPEQWSALKDPFLERTRYILRYRGSPRYERDDAPDVERMDTEGSQAKDSRSARSDEAELKRKLEDILEVDLWTKSLSELPAPELNVFFNKAREKIARLLQEASVELFGRRIPADAPTKWTLDRMDTKGRTWWRYSRSWRPRIGPEDVEIRKDLFYSAADSRLIVVVCTAHLPLSPAAEFEKLQNVAEAMMRRLLEDVKITVASGKEGNP